MTNRSQSVEVIVRFHDPLRLEELERAVFSLVSQNIHPITIHIVTQRFDIDALAATRMRLKPLFHVAPQVEFAIHNWCRASPQDARSCLINEGLRHIAGRYLAFLDYDDVLFPEAYGVLRERLRVCGAAITFAGIQTMTVAVFQEFVSIQRRANPPFRGRTLLDLFNANFAPIHSYMIDLEKIDKEDLYFDENMNWEEDYEFLLRICSKYESDFENLSIPIGYYNFKIDGSNSVPLTPEAFLARENSYRFVCETIRRRKAQITVSPQVLARLAINISDKSHVGHPLTIEDVNRMAIKSGQGVHVKVSVVRHGIAKVVLSWRERGATETGKLIITRLINRWRRLVSC